MKRKLILQMQMSVDGYVGVKGHGIDWQLWDWASEWLWDPALKADFNAVFDTIDTILLSRPMAEQGYIEHWTRTAETHTGEPEFAFAQKVVSAKKIIATSKPMTSGWPQTTISKAPLIQTVAGLKAQSGSSIITFGGAKFASALIAAGLVDEFQFFINPATIGDGVSLFGTHTNAMKLTLKYSKAYACGMVVSRYTQVQ